MTHFVVIFFYLDIVVILKKFFWKNNRQNFMYKIAFLSNCILFHAMESKIFKAISIDYESFFFCNVNPLSWKVSMTKTSYIFTNVFYHQ